MLPGRGQPRGLVHPEMGHAGQPCRIVDQRPSMPLDRAHDGAPPDGVLAGHLRDRGAIAADPENVNSTWPHRDGLIWPHPVDASGITGHVV